MDGRLLKIVGAVFLSFLLLGFLASLWFAKAPNPVNSRALLVMASREIGTAWISGRHPRQEKVVCPQLFTDWPRPPEMLKCNALFLKCLFENRPLKFEGGQVKVQFEQSGLPYKIVSKAHSQSVVPGYALEAWLESGSIRQRIWLEDHCSGVYLPQRIYGYGKSGKTAKFPMGFLWDNFGQHWFIDRRQVTHREVLEWREQTGISLKEPLSEDLKDHYRPVGGLYPQEMRDYCHFRGKQLATAALLDAAFFLPSDLNDSLARPTLRGPYPWTQKRTLKTPSPGLQSCSRIPARDCGEYVSTLREFSASPTWQGSFQALGGLPERVDNFLYPRRNLNLSSHYFSLDSKVHAIAERGHWSGRGFGRSFFSLGTWELPHEVDRLGVGFRCAKQRWGSEKF